MNAARLGADPAFAGAGTDQRALKLAKSGQDLDDQTSLRRRGVRPCVAERAELSAGLCHRVEDVQEFARGSRQPIEARDKQGVARLKDT
jgi:hypothetical protein